jgi:hypothetical protein
MGIAFTAFQRSSTWPVFGGHAVNGIGWLVSILPVELSGGTPSHLPIPQTYTRRGSHNCPNIHSLGTLRVSPLDLAGVLSRTWSPWLTSSSRSVTCGHRHQPLFFFLVFSPTKTMSTPSTHSFRHAIVVRTKTTLNPVSVRNATVPEVRARSSAWLHRWRGPSPGRFSPPNPPRPLPPTLVEVAHTVLDGL